MTVLVNLSCKFVLISCDLCDFRKKKRTSSTGVNVNKLIQRSVESTFDDPLSRHRRQD